MPPQFQVVKVFPQRGYLCLHRLVKPAAFTCNRCGLGKTSKLVAFAKDKWDEPVCNGCYGYLLAASQINDCASGTRMAHLSLTYHSQGRRTEAEELGLQVMELRKKVLGPEHHHTLTSMGNLASIYLDGQLAKAEELLLQVLAIRIRVLGMEHHHSLTSMEQLAGMYRNQGRLKESEDLEAQVEEARNNAVS